MIPPEHSAQTPAFPSDGLPLTTPAGPSAAAPLAGAPPSDPTANVYTGATPSSWDTPGNWSLGTVPGASDAVLFDHSFLNPMVDSQLNNSFTISTLSFDTGADSYIVLPNLGNGAFRSLSFLGGTNALGGPQAIALSVGTTGTIQIGRTGQDGNFLIAFGMVPISIAVADPAATLHFGAAACITGTSGLTKTGAGTLYLEGPNNYAGPTIVNAGTLAAFSLAKGGAFSSIGMSSSAAGNLVLHDCAFRYVGHSADPQTDRLFTLSGSGVTLDASGQDSLAFINPGAIAFATPNTACALTLAGTSVATLMPALGNNGSGVTSLTKTGTGTWTLHGANNYTGATMINGGTLVLDSGTGNTVLPAGAIILVANGTLRLQGSSYNVFQLPALTVGAGGFVDAASNVHNAHTLGNTLLQGGTLMSSGPADPTWGNFVLNNGATITANGDVASVINAHVFQAGVNAAINVGTDTSGALSLLTISSQIQNYNGTPGSALHKQGPGILTLTGANTYTGPTTIVGGIVTAAALANGGAPSNIGASPNTADNLVLDGGTLQYIGPAQSTDRLFTLGNGGGTLDSEGGLLSFTNPGAIALSGTASLRTLTLQGFLGEGTIASLLADNGPCQLALVKEGQRAWELTNANTYTGGTTVSDGTLIANHPGFPSHHGPFAPGSTVTVNRLGTLLCVGTDEFGFYESSANLVINGGVVTTDNSTGNHTTLQNVVMTGGLITSQSTDHHFFLNGPLTTNANANAAVINCPQFELGQGWPTVGSATITVARGTTSDGVDLRIDSQVYHHALVKNGPGTLQLTNAGNFYDEGTTINGGTISVLSLGNGGGNSSLGRSSNAAANFVLNGGTLQYIGTVNASTDRLFTMGSAGAALDVSGTGSATFGGNNATGTNAIAFSSPNTAQTLTLTGSGLGGLGTSLRNNGTGLTSLNKTGAGTWILNGANTYTGATTINGGTLALDNSAHASPLPARAIINVVNGTLRLQGTENNAFWLPTLTVSASGIVDAASSTKNAHTLGTTLLQGGTLKSSTAPDPTWGNFVLNNNATLTASGNADSLISAQVFQVGANATINVGTGTNGTPSLLTISAQIQNYSGMTANVLHKSGAGTLALTGTNTYTGPTTITGGIVSTTALANGGSPSNIGASPNTADRLVLDGGTLQYTGPAVNIDRLFSLGAAGGTIDVANFADLTLANPGPIGFAGAPSARTLTLGGSASGTLAALLGDNGGARTSVTKIGSGSWKLTGASTYTGVTAIRGGLLLAGVPANGGLPSSLGAASNAAANLVLDGGSLMYTNSGPASATDRLFSLGPNGGALGVTGGAVTFQGNGSGSANAIGFTSPNTPATLSLVSGPGTLVPVLGNNGSGTTSLTKASPGTWTLAGANTYTGTTLVSAGVLLITAPQACPSYLVTGTNPGGSANALLMAPFFYGTLTLGADNVLASNATITINGSGIFDVGIYHSTVATVTLAKGAIIGTTGVLSATGLFDLQSGAVSAILSGPGSLAKSTPAPVTLTGTNTYTGGTSLNSGTLVLGGAGSLGSTGSIFFGGGTLQFSSADTGDYSARFSGAANQLYNLDTSNQAVTLATGLTSPGGILNKLGAGTLTLSGPSTYTGATNVLAGALIVSATDSIPAASAVMVNSGGTLRLGSYSNAIGSLTGTGSVDLGSGVLDTGYDGTDTTFSGIISDTGGGILSKSGPGTFTVTGANTYTGGTRLQEGTLSLGNAGALGSTGLISFGGGTLQFTAADMMDYSARFSTAAGQLYSLDTNGQYITLASGLTSSGGTLTKWGSGVLSLTGNNTYNGVTNLMAGTLSLGSVGALDSPAQINFGGGALQFTAANSFDYSPRFSTADGQLYNLDTNGRNIVLGTALSSNNGSLTKSGTGTLNLPRVNTYTGPTTINSGVLSLGTVNALPATSGVTINSGGTLSFSFPNAFNSISGVGTISLGATLTVGADDSSTTFSGLISSSVVGGSLVKVGLGTLTLTNSNTYLGRTVINGGAIEIDHLSYGSIPSGIGASSSVAANLVLNGGTLRITGSGYNSTDRLFTLGANGGTIDLETDFGQTIFSNPGSLAFAGTNTSPILTLTGGNYTNGSMPIGIRNNGIGRTAVLKTGNGDWDLSGANTYTGPTIINAGRLNLSNSLPNFSSPVTIQQPGLLNIVGPNSVGSLAGDGTVTINSAALTTGYDNTSTTFSGTLSFYNGSLIKTGTGKFTFTGSLIASPNDSIDLNGGIFTVGDNNTLRFFPATISFSGGALQFSASDNLYLTCLSSGPGQLYSFDTNGYDVTFYNGFYSSNGSLTKLGLGRLTLTTDSFYIGPTTIKGGILSVSNLANGGVPSSIGQSSSAAASLLLNGGVLEITLGGAVTTDRLISLGAGGGTISVGTAPGAVSFTNPGLIGFDVTNAARLLRLDAVANASGVFSPIIANNGTGKTSLSKTGDGDWSLAGVNTYGGATTVSQGRLTTGNGNLPLASAVTVNQPGVLHLTGTAVIGSLGGNGTVVVDSGHLTVGGNNGASTFSGTLSLPAGSQLIKAGTGVFSLDAPISLPAGITLVAGALGLAVPGALGSTGQITFNGGSLQFSATDSSDYSSRFSTAPNQRYSFDTNGVDITFATPLNSSGCSLAKLGAGALILNLPNNFPSGITLSGGFVELGYRFALGTSGTITFRGGGLRFTENNVTDYSPRFSTVAGQTFVFDTNGFDIVFHSPCSSSGGSLIKYGSGVLNLAAPFTYTGRTTINGGTLLLGTSNALSSSSMISVAPGAIFDLGNLATRTGSLNGGGNVDVGNGTLDIGYDNASTGVFSGSISGPYGGLVKSGTGTQTFSGASLNYRGATTIASGTLIFNGTLTGTSRVQVGGSSVATLSGLPSIVLGAGGTFDIENQGTLNPGAGSASGLTINFSNGDPVSVFFQSGSTIRFTLANSQGSGNPPALADYTAINVGAGVSIYLGGSIDLVVGSANIGDLFPIIAGAGSISGLFDNANVPAPNNAGSCYRFTAANGSVWDINTAWTGNAPQSGADPTAFEQTIGGTNVALLRVS